MIDLEIHGLSKRFNVGQHKVPALNSIEMCVGHGEFCILLGKSGCGKTTLLNIVAGIDKADTGSVCISGYDITYMNERQLSRFRQHHIGFIFQSYNLLPHLTALENVELPMIFRGENEALRREKARSALDSVGLLNWASHKPAELSGGQQQRVGIARAFASSPTLVLADEPTGNLDRANSVEVVADMRRRAREKGITVLMVTHDEDLIGAADRVIRIEEGYIISDRGVG